MAKDSAEMAQLNAKLLAAQQRPRFKMEPLTSTENCCLDSEWGKCCFLFYACASRSWNPQTHFDKVLLEEFKLSQIAIQAVNEVLIKAAKTIDPPLPLNDFNYLDCIEDFLRAEESFRNIKTQQDAMLKANALFTPENMKAIYSECQFRGVRVAVMKGID